MFHKGEMVINSINKAISKGYHVISVRTIKRLNNIDKSDRSINNYIWRNLEVLEKKGFLEKIKEAPLRKYILPTTPINLNEVMEK